jgi:hypothetical protein
MTGLSRCPRGILFSLSGSRGAQKTGDYFLISNFHRVLNVVCFLLGNSPASEVHIPVKMEQTECSETSAY